MSTYRAREGLYCFSIEERAICTLVHFLTTPPKNRGIGICIWILATQSFDVFADICFVTPPFQVSVTSLRSAPNIVMMIHVMNNDERIAIYAIPCPMKLGHIWYFIKYNHFLELEFLNWANCNIYMTSLGIGWCRVTYQSTHQVLFLHHRFAMKSTTDDSSLLNDLWVHCEKY